MKPDAAEPKVKSIGVVIDWLRRSVVVRGKTGGARTAAESQDDSNPSIFIPPEKIGALDRMPVADAERRSPILPVQESCREDRPIGSSASLAASSTTDKAVQFNARKQSSPRAFFCWPIESIKSSILLPCLARGKEESSYGEVTVSADANADAV